MCDPAEHVEGALAHALAIGAFSAGPGSLGDRGEFQPRVDRRGNSLEFPAVSEQVQKFAKMFVRHAGRVSGGMINSHGS